MESRNHGGADARDLPEYRQALIDIAVCVNAAQAAFDLRQEVEARRQVGDRGPLRCVQPAQPPGEYACRSHTPPSRRTMSTWLMHRPIPRSSERSRFGWRRCYGRLERRGRRGRANQRRDDKLPSKRQRTRVVAAVLARTIALAGTARINAAFLRVETLGRIYLPRRRGHPKKTCWAEPCVFQAARTSFFKGGASTDPRKLSTNADDGRSQISRGVPICSTRPRLRTIT